MNHAHVAMLAHTARILRALGDKPRHPRKKEYALTIEDYREQWRVIPKRARAEAVEAAEGLHDMSEADVIAAVAALEG